MRWLFICAILAGTMADARALAGGGKDGWVLPSRGDLSGWRNCLAGHLQKDVLGFWLMYGPDLEYGGFHGQINRIGKPDPAAEKSLVLESRIVWTFAAAYRDFPRDEYRKAAKDAFDFMEQHLWDREHGGWFWSVSRSGGMLDGKKHLYGQSFAIYAMAEYYRAFGDKKALDRAMEDFGLMEKHAHDQKYGGYLEPFTREWKPDAGENPIGPSDQKSTNTHLHLMESFTNLFRAGNDPLVRKRLEEVYGILLTRVTDPAGYAHEYFKPDWTPVPSPDSSYGHEVEEAWLLLDTASALGRPKEEKCARLAKALVDRSLKYGTDEKDGSLYARGPVAGPPTDRARTWWVEAEFMVGLLAVYDLTRDRAYLDAFDRLSRWIMSNLADREYGEWFQEVKADGKLDDAWKVTPWKCPYHNSRALLESIRRLDQIAGK
jgi:mannobiose 2-epimerase